MLLEKSFPLCDSGDIVAFELEPPVGFQFVLCYTLRELSVSKMKS